ncbi:hypothetical protein RUND412_001031 [Rhizina undulata]
MALGQSLLIRNQQTVQKQLQHAQQTHAKISPQEQHLRHEQSLELVQTLLGASIGCLSFLRGLLPEECFVERRYGGKSSAVTSYRSFTSDIEEEDCVKKSKSDSGTRVKRLRRGYSGEADQLLDWLETGIFDALQKKYLKAVQLGIYVDKDHPDIIVEAYTFSFSYRDNEDGTSAISMKITNNDGHGITMNDANKNLQQMMRRLIVITQNLPPLPDKRWLTIRLHYRDHTPKDYDPPDFARLAANAPALRFCESENKEVEKMDCGGLNAGFHAVSLKISSLQEANSQERPKRRYLSRFVHADVDIEPPQFAFPQYPQQKAIRDLKAVAPFESTNTDSQGRQKSASKTPGDCETYSEGMETANNLLPTEKISKRDTKEKEILRGMLVSKAREDDLVGTQPLEFSQLSRQASHDVTSTNINPSRSRFAGPQVLAQDNPGFREMLIDPAAVPVTSPAKKLHEESVFTPHAVISQQITKSQHKKINPVKPSDKLDEALASVGKCMAKLKLSKAKAEELQKDGGKETNNKVIGKSVSKGKEKAERRSRESSVTCECGDGTDLGGMICCDHCDGWLHVNCYGFLTEKDPRIPDYHVCYTCLLGKNEGKLLEEMRGLALFRRALKKLWDDGVFPTSNKVFSGMIGCDLPTALQITKRLENEGFITAHTSTRHGRTQKLATVGPARYKVVKTEGNKHAMDTQYFDPLLKISHHFDFPTAMDLDQMLPKDKSVLPRSLPYTESTSMMTDAIVDETHDVGNITEEAIFVSQKDTKNCALNFESTDDEEMSDDSLNVPERVSDNAAFLANNGNHEYSMLPRPPFEVPETPEPMDLDGIGGAQEVSQEERSCSIITVPGSPQEGRISEVKQNLYVGIEDEY